MAFTERVYQFIMHYEYQIQIRVLQDILVTLSTKVTVIINYEHIHIMS